MATTQILRRQEEVIDVTMTYRLVEFNPGHPGRWQGEPADVSPPERSDYVFAFTGATLDDPDEQPLTPSELVSLRVWFWANHDTVTEAAADHLRGDGL